MPLPSAQIHTITNPEPQSAPGRRLHRYWLTLARIAWFAVVLVTLVLYVVGTPVYFAQFHTPCTGCLDERLTPDEAQALHALGISTTTYAAYWVAVNVLFALVYFAVAMLIFWRKSNDQMVLLASFSLVALGASFPSIPSTLATVCPAWWLPVAFLVALGFPSLTVFLFLFPNGRFVPRWTRWVAVGWAAMNVPVAFFPGSIFNFANWPRPLYLLVSLVVLGSMVFAQIYRYRRISTPVERQQTKWVVFGAAVALLGFLLVFLTSEFFPVERLALLPSVFGITSIYLLLLLIPLSMAIAVLRYRLWDVDVLINKTLVYGLVTGTLAAVYTGCVVGLQALLRGLFNQTSYIAIVVSTLVIAALFQPLRKRIQAVIDRRFFRRKYDAARTLASFSATLRNELDLSQLSEQLVAVVQETMLPAHVSLWLREPEGGEKRQGEIHRSNLYRQVMPMSTKT